MLLLLSVPAAAKRTATIHGRKSYTTALSITIFLLVSGLFHDTNCNLKLGGHKPILAASISIHDCQGVS
jgi:hypothetical protein